MADDDASWYQRKMAAIRGGQSLPTVQRPQYPQPVPQYQQPQPQYQQNVPQAVPAAGTPETLTDLLEMQRHGHAIGPGRGGKLNREPCPNCGGNLYYHDLGKKSRGPSPAPHCFTCGYNDLFEQGLESNWQNGS